LLAADSSREQASVKFGKFTRFPSPGRGARARSTRLDGPYEVGKRGMGVCSFTMGIPPEDLAERVDAYRRGIADCTEPVGKFVNDRVATFTMVHVAATNQQAYDEAGDSMAWYPSHAGRLLGETARPMEGIGDGELGTDSYMEGAKELGALRHSARSHPAFDRAARKARDSGAGSRLSDRA
jgi:hypothetical protein